MKQGPWLLRGIVIVLAVPAIFVSWALLSSLIFAEPERHATVHNHSSSVVTIRIGSEEVDVPAGDDARARISSKAPLDAVRVTAADGSIRLAFGVGRVGDTEITVSNVSGLPPLPAPVSPPP